MMDERANQIYNRLKAQMDAQKVMIKANPFPYLDRMNEENARLRSIIDRAYFVLSGAEDFTYAQDIAPTMNPSLVEVSLRRGAEALGILDEATK